MINILYKGERIHTDLTHEECAEILEQIAEEYFEGNDINPNEIEIEEI